MAALKTQPSNLSVLDFLNSIQLEEKRKDSFQLMEIMQKLTGDLPKMWGASIIGFGDYHYKYASGREGDWFLVGFSPRKPSFSIYLMCDYQNMEDLLSQLGKFKTGKSCLYVKNLEDININILKRMIRKSIKELKNRQKKTK